MLSPNEIASSVEHFMMPLNVEWYYDGMRDAVMVVTTTTTYTLAYLGHLNNVAEVPPTPAPMDLWEFLQPTLASLENELVQKIKPILEPEPLPKYIP